MVSEIDAKNGKKYSGMSLLVADDEEQIVKVLKTIGEMLGFKVITAKDGQEALKVFKKKKPDMVISDIYMPYINGLFLLLKIKEVRADCPVLLMTGYKHYKQLIEKDELRPDGFIEKPFSVDQIYEMIEKAATSHK